MHLRHHALIVSPVPVLARMLADGLGDAGWSTEVACRAGEALASLESGEFDAVVADVDIPDGDGFELVACVRAQPGPVPAVVLTGLVASPRLARRASEAGALGYLPRPFELEVLLDLLERAVSEAGGAPH